MPFLKAIQTELPQNTYSQKEIALKLQDLWKERFFNTDRIEEFFKNVCVEKRSFALPLEAYAEEMGLEKRNKAWMESAVDLGERCISRLLEESQVDPESIGAFFSNTVTGFAVPSLEAKLMNKLDLPLHLRRVPLFGLGCLAGTAAINLAAEWLQSKPQSAALFYTAELCSLTFQWSDMSISNLVGTGLFGDGAAAVLMVGDEHPLAKNSPLQWCSGHSSFYKNSERVMGWDIVDSGLKLVLGPEVPKFAKEQVAKDLADILSNHSPVSQAPSFVVAHPGGPKVLEAFEETKLFPKEYFHSSWSHLKNEGNLSSASVLFIAKKLLEQKWQRDEWGPMFSMGPGFCSEVAVLSATGEK